ncbi:MAG TPA: OsmC family protein [Firmicutes bacterium]|nr:OsmC family protein [Bacillota bacterium]
MQAKVRWNRKLGFIGTSGTNHIVPMDVAEESGGDGAAASPMELVLLGLAGCSGVDVALITKKKRLNVHDFEILVAAERAADHPRVFTAIDLTFVFTGEDLKPKPLEDAVRLSVERYCSVAGMLNKTAEIKWRVEIK